MKLLWLIDSLTVGGAEALIVPFARRLDRSRFEFTVCALTTIAGNAIETRLREDGVRVLNLGATDLRDREAFRKLEALVRDEGIDLIHAHLTYAGIWSALITRRTGVPSIVSLHVAPEASMALQTSTRQKVATAVRDRLMRFAINRWSNRVVMVSNALRDIYLAGGGLRASKIRVVRNGIELDRFERDRAETRARVTREFNLPENTPILATVSVLREAKGVEVLLEAMREIPAANLLIIGDGPKAEEWQALAKYFEVDDRVRWAGYRTDVDALLAGCDLLVHPTLSDAFPTVLLEAMGAGLPIVASNVGGIPEIVEPGVTGLLVPSGDPKALAAAVAELLLDPNRLREMGQRARTSAKQNFSTEAWISRLTAVYDEVLETAKIGAAV